MVQFSSLEEVYGKDFTRKYEEKLVSQQDFTRVNYDKDPLPLFLKNKGYNQSDCFEVKSQYSSFNSSPQSPQSVQSNPQQPMNGRYQEMLQKSNMDRKQQIDHMNQVERPFPSAQDCQTAFLNAEDQFRKKMLTERLSVIENELKKYREKNHFVGQPIPSTSTPPPQKEIKENLKIVYKPKEDDGVNLDMVESFQNLNPSPLTTKLSSTNQELMDIILITAMGLFLIFIMDSIFTTGKSIGSRRKL